MSTHPTTTVTNDDGLTFTVRYVATGAAYGLGDCLTNEGAPMVEFFDATADAERFGPLGQFASRYYVDTLAGVAERGRGIALYGGVPDWTVTAANVAEVAAWLGALATVPDRIAGPHWSMALVEAYELRSEDGTNYEYDRALCELLARLYPIADTATEDRAGQVAALIGARRR